MVKDNRKNKCFINIFKKQFFVKNILFSFFKKIFNICKKHKKISLSSIILLLIVYKLFFPNTVYVPVTSSVENIADFMYWEWKDERNIEYKKYHEKKAIEYAEREIKKNTNNDERILDLFKGMNLKQGINIHKNTETNQIYVFTTPSKHQSILSIYDYDKESLILKKQIKIWHLYEVYDGIYDDKTNKIYLGVLHFKFNEGTWGNNSMDGYAIVHLDYMEKINNILGVQ